MNTSYTTTAPIRWDELAMLAYGDVLKMPLIFEANPGIPADTIIPENTTVLLPIIDVVENEEDFLPPWKQ